MEKRDNERVYKMLVIISILIGIVLLFTGVLNFKSQKKISKKYISTQGEFLQKKYFIDEYSEDKKVTKSSKYMLVYKYSVDSQDYMVSTSYATRLVPKIGDKKEILYNSQNPSEAIIPGFEYAIASISVGISFILVAIIVLLLYKSSNKKTVKLENDKISLITIIANLYVIIGGLIIYFLLCAKVDTLSFKEVIVFSRLLIVIPAIFIIVGVYNCIGYTIKILKYNNGKSS